MSERIGYAEVLAHIRKVLSTVALEDGYDLTPQFKLWTAEDVPEGDLDVHAWSRDRGELNRIVARLAEDVAPWKSLVDDINFFDTAGRLVATLMLPRNPHALQNALRSTPDLTRADLPADELFWQGAQWSTAFGEKATFWPRAGSDTN